MSKIGISILRCGVMSRAYMWPAISMFSNLNPVIPADSAALAQIFDALTSHLCDP